MAERTFNSNSATCVQWEGTFGDALERAAEARG